MPLKRVPRSLSPKLLGVLARMGHGDELLICDANFPSHSQHVRHVVHSDASSATDLLADVLQLLPLDSFTRYQAAVMKQVDSDQDAAIVADFDQLLNRAFQGEDRSPVRVEIERVERFAFYERAKQVFAICVTGESRLYGNVIVKKGVLDAHGHTVVASNNSKM